MALDYGGNSVHGLGKRFGKTHWPGSAHSVTHATNSVSGITDEVMPMTALFSHELLNTVTPRIAFPAWAVSRESCW